jgi:hypothetical protein
MTQFGREKELEIIREVIKNVYSAGLGFLTASIATHADGATPMTVDEKTDYITSSTRSEASKSPPSPIERTSSTKLSSVSMAGSSPTSDIASLYSGSVRHENLRRTAISLSKPRDQVHSIIIYGPPGYDDRAARGPTHC